MGTCLRLAFGALAATLALSPVTARGDVIAVVSHLTPTNGFDVVRVNTGTGGVSPAPFNTAQSERGASVSSDGTRIVFEQTPPATASPETVLVDDLRTGNEASVFSQSQIASRPFDPSISPDGQTILTGGPFQPFSPPLYFSAVTLTSLATFPTGPYTQSFFDPPYTFSTSSGVVRDPVQSGSLLAFTVFGGTPTEEVVFGQVGGLAAPPLASATTSYFHPAIGSPGGVPTVVFDTESGGSFGLASRPASLSSFVGAPTPLPAAANSSGGLYPVFTADGRYLAFMRGPNTSSGHTRLFVWDTETQTLINPAGVDVGVIDLPYGLYETPVFIGGTGIGVGPVVGSASFDLAAGSAVGILVQRVVGHHRLFGRTVPTLKLVGRVPLGNFRKGRRHVHWDLRVNGHRLRRGTYQLTLRSLSASKKIRDFGVPHLIHVR
jgi:WD40-like Beta Propeller Repeat